MTRYEQRDIDALADYTAEYVYAPPDWVEEATYERAKAIVEKARSEGKLTAIVWNKKPNWNPKYIKNAGFKLERFTWSNARYGGYPIRVGWVMSGPNDPDKWDEVLSKMRYHGAWTYSKGIHIEDTHNEGQH